MIVCRAKSEMEWLVISEREKKLVLYKFPFLVFIGYVTVNFFLFTSADF